MVNLCDLNDPSRIIFPAKLPDPTNFNSNLIFLDLSYAGFPNMRLTLEHVPVHKFQHFKGDNYERRILSVVIQSHYEGALETIYTALAEKIEQWFPNQSFNIKIPLFANELSLSFPQKIEMLYFKDKNGHQVTTTHPRFFEKDCPEMLTPGTLITADLWAFAWVNPDKKEAGWSFKLRYIEIIHADFLNAEFVNSQNTNPASEYEEIPAPLPSPPPPTSRPKRLASIIQSPPPAPRKQRPFRTVEVGKYASAIKKLPVC